MPCNRNPGGHRVSCRPRGAQTSCSSSQMTPASAFPAPSAASFRRPRWTASPTNGLRYNRIMSTALCSPTRAALITGRNHHSVGFGVIAEQSTGFPGYNSIIGVDNATIGRILLDNGYATRRGSARTTTPRPFQPARPGRSPVADRHGLRILLRFRRRRLQPVGAEPVPQHHADLSLPGFPEQGKEPGSWNLITGMADDAIDWAIASTRRSEQTDFPPSTPRRLPRAAPSDQGVGGQDQRDAPVRRWL
jgi:arylsulfatase A-like enzyme